MDRAGLIERLAGLAMLLSLAACEPSCPETFAEGEIIGHRLNDQYYVVLKSSPIRNFQDLCLVTVRAHDGALQRLDVNELRSLDTEGPGR